MLQNHQLAMMIRFQHFKTENEGHAVEHGLCERRMIWLSKVLVGKIHGFVSFSTDTKKKTPPG